MVTALILAGGRATRMGGAAKHELLVDGQTILARQCAVLAPRVSEIVLSAARATPGLRTVHDAPAFGGAGPLAGIAAGLAGCRTPWLLIVAGDMPDLNGALIDLLLARASGDDGDAVALRVADRPQPLLCALRVAPAATAVTAMLAAGEHKASRLLTDQGLRVTWIDEAFVRAIDPELRGLRNINSPHDLAVR